MTEIALALAMAFFSLMVLTLISMGAGKGDNPAVAAAMFAPAPPAAAATVELDTGDMIVVYHGGRFLDRDLKPIDPAAIVTTGRVILALAPDMPLAEAMAARTRINVANLVVSTLDDRWLTTLRSKTNARD